MLAPMTTGPGPLTIHIGRDELIIRKRYEVLSIVNDILGIWRQQLPKSVEAVRSLDRPRKQGPGTTAGGSARRPAEAREASVALRMPAARACG